MVTVSGLPRDTNRQSLLGHQSVLPRHDPRPTSRTPGVD